MTNVKAVNFTPIVSRKAVDEAFHDALHQLVGRGRLFSVKRLQNESGVKERCIEAAMAPVDGPDFRPLNRENQFSVMSVLGADFANLVLPVLTRVGTFDLPSEDLPPPCELVADAAEDAATIARAAADGKFCAHDRPKLWLVGQDFMKRGMQLVGLGKARPKVAA